MEAEALEHEEEDWEEVEAKREEASLEQAQHFRDLYNDLDTEQQDAIKHWLKQEDTNLQEEFAVWYGEDEYAEEFESDNL
jgi:hypothetical protein